MVSKHTIFVALATIFFIIIFVLIFGFLAYGEITAKKVNPANTTKVIVSGLLESGKGSFCVTNTVIEPCVSFNTIESSIQFKKIIESNGILYGTTNSGTLYRRPAQENAGDWVQYTYTNINEIGQSDDNQILVTTNQGIVQHCSTIDKNGIPDVCKSLQTLTAFVGASSSSIPTSLSKTGNFYYVQEGSATPESGQIYYISSKDAESGTGSWIKQTSASSPIINTMKGYESELLGVSSSGLLYICPITGPDNACASSSGETVWQQIPIGTLKFTDASIRGDFYYGVDSENIVYNCAFPCNEDAGWQPISDINLKQIS